MKGSKIISAAAILGLAFSAGVSANAENLNGAGATFPYPVYSAWAYKYNQQKGIKVNYQSIGSGGGQKQIFERTVDFGASDEPLEPAALSEHKLLQFPAVVGGVVPVVNIRGVRSGILKLDSETLCKVFMGEIKDWSDPAIKALNPGLGLSGKVTVVHRADGSGTTAIFTKYLATTCPAWNSKIGAGKAVSWPVGLGGKGNEGVANYVQRTSGSIGYVELAYAEQNHLTAIMLKNRAGQFVAPSLQAFMEAAASGDFSPSKHFYAWLINTPGRGAWPIAGATFILLAKDNPAASTKAYRFYEWAFQNGDADAKRLVYVPLPEKLKGDIRAYMAANGIK